MNKIRIVDFGAPFPTRFNVQKFDQWSFESPSSEEAILVTHADKSAVDCAIDFWIWSMLADDWHDRTHYFIPYAETALCAPLTESEFLSIVKQRCSRLKQMLPAFMNNSQGFITALKMFDDWNDVAAIAEYETCYTAFYWNTTA